MSTDLTVSTDDQWKLLQRQCSAFVASGFLPDHITRGCKDRNEAIARAVTIAIKGRELGVPPMQAFTSITVIKGKPCLSAELMLALVYQRIKGAKVTFKETTAENATVVMQRPDGEPQTFSFTIDDAKRAGLLNGGAWSKYPQAMLRARVISAGARAVFPDAIMGCYIPEEMGEENVELDTEIHEVQVEEPEAEVAAKPEMPERAKELVEQLNSHSAVESVEYRT